MKSKKELLSKIVNGRYFTGIAVSLFLFLLLLPLSLKIDFMQNDDWVYYGMVENFMKLDFRLDPLSAPTFYTQGILGTLFAGIFGLQSLPILTLIISVLCFFVFYIILLRHFNLGRFESVLVSLLLFFNPLFIYSVWGFMTENYFLLFMLLSILFYLESVNVPSRKNLFLYVVFIFLALNIRQVALVLPLSGFVYSLFKRNVRPLLLNLGVLVGLGVYYVFIFPLTAEMSEKSLQFHHLQSSPYVYSLIYGSFILATALLLPLLLPIFKEKKKLKWALFLGLAVVAYILLNRYFQPSKVSWGEFPYFENTLERKGFYPRGVLGTKYYFKYMFDLYRHWDSAAKIVLSLFVAYAVLKIKKINGLWAVFTIIYMGVMTVTETYYDRYLLILIPVLIFIILGVNGFGKVNKFLSVSFLAFLIFYNYQFSMDFILVNKYIWNKSEELVVKYDKEPRRVQGTNAWKLKYLNERRNYVFDFTYDSSEINKSYRDLYTTEEGKKIEFPGSLWVKPYIYLYQKID
ncbi:MAG: hypothetical protein UU64_C0006G0028 [candidate division WWE3 bacterium GW2011_GWF2_41_45]|nr:MAG: hypothetical protein UU55_C0005G0026 [candidate division WWE3 bacterium GW2011_GWC2_41_23]KKS10277.1 MAG: hypothetical protein UU64_C0006G0028 [candidate division WWE3 bacterium GW2011_GWF2_41_45]KKS12244.1 MAG: hypothetical protein UU68_C0003G0028 [candidate division WWE3 bacterium GW2011_GWF1_41_53]KKS20019.1 MAG: hypothetical protein UU79_C0005G0027 [candidate division WWE3 bacterium GW2011_GWE1_41_72]KKS29332.1 MAG: hypothetical protein UU90_C0010G0028 [candidate division WWE3 bacte